MNIGYCEWTTQNYSVEYRRVLQNSVRTEYPRYLPDSPLYYPAQHDEKAESRALNAQHNGPLHQNQHHTRKDTATPHPEQNPSHPTPHHSCSLSRSVCVPLFVWAYTAVCAGGCVCVSVVSLCVQTHLPACFADVTSHGVMHRSPVLRVIVPGTHSVGYGGITEPHRTIL